MKSVPRRRLERQDRAADVAAHLHVAAELAQDVRDERRRRRLAVGAGDGDERRLGARERPLAAEELDVADDLDARGAGLLDRPVRLGMRERHAGRQHERGKRAQSAAERSTSGSPAFAAAARPGSPSSQAATSAPPAASARADAMPEAPRPNTATRLSLKAVTRIMERSLAGFAPPLATGSRSF